MAGIRHAGPLGFSEALYHWVSLFMTDPMFRIYSFIYEKFLLAQVSVLVLCTKLNVQIGADGEFYFFPLVASPRMGKNLVLSSYPSFNREKINPHSL